MWHIYKMKYHSSIKNKESMKFEVKRMGFKIFILSVAIRIQKCRCGMYSLSSEYFFSHIVQNNHAKIQT